MNDIEIQLDPFESSATQDDCAAAVELQPVGSKASEQTILVLEDDPLQRTILSRHLGSLELNVIEASTIREALEKLRNRPVQLAIVDINLPDGSGFTLCEQIDEDPDLAGMPTIVLSSMTQSDLVRKTRASGGCFFLGKPYDPNVLLAIIERALGTDLQ